ncbi:MAG: hypothetical protein PWQ48_1790 [Thermotogaceae bacterium]|nr:hypothetical protein [Thermotogaceae bacterium]
MSYRGLYVFVEGNDDERFFQCVLLPELKKSYDYIGIMKYAEEEKEKIESFLDSIKAMIGVDYIFVHDIDNSPCVTTKKEKLYNWLKNLDKEKIVVVIKEIESWYLAGLCDDNLQHLKIRMRDVSSTESITKEDFNSLIPQKYDSRIDFMQEVLKHFSIDVAKQKNRSFKYFYEKYIGQ